MPSGYGEDYDGPTGGAGPTFARYDHFTDPERRELVNVIRFPTRADRDLQWYHIQSWVVVGDTLWGESSWLDIPHAMNAFVRENGEIVVILKNNWKNLRIVFRIPPGQAILEGLDIPASGLPDKRPQTV